MCRRPWMRPASCKLLGAQIVENEMSSCYQPLSFDSGWKMTSRASGGSCESAIAIEPFATSDSNRNYILKRVGGISIYIYRCIIFDYIYIYNFW